MGNGHIGPNPSREVTGGHGSSREQIAAIWRPLAKQPFWAKSWPGGHGRSREVRRGHGRSREVTGGWGGLREVTGGYGRGKRRKVEEREEKGRRKPKKMTEMSSVKCGVRSVECKVCSEE